MKNLGTVTAYGHAKAGGYTGTEAEFSRAMAGYGDSFIDDDYHYTTGSLHTNGHPVGSYSIDCAYSELVPTKVGINYYITMGNTSHLDVKLTVCEYDNELNLLGSRIEVVPDSSLDQWTYIYIVTNNNAKYIRFSYRRYSGSVTFKVERSIATEIYSICRKFNELYTPEYTATGLDLTNGTITGVNVSGDVVTVDNSYAYRVCTETIISRETPIYISVANGFKIKVYYKTPSAEDYSESGWVSGIVSYNTPGTKIGITIARSTEDTSETADLEEFGNAVDFGDPISSARIQLDTLLSALN